MGYFNLHKSWEDRKGNFEVYLERGGVNLSLQGSSSHYSSPREDLLSLDEFDELEVFIYGEGNLGDSLVDIYVKLEEYEDYPGSDTFVFVPKEVVIEVCEDFKGL